MNRFILHANPFIAAEMHCDKHLVKMIIEEAQMLSTAHRILDGIEYSDKTANGRSIKRWKLADSRDTKLYKATHQNHPCAIWSRESSSNYIWGAQLLCALLNEYTYRYERIHKTQDIFDTISHPPKNIRIGPLTEFPQAMPDDCKDKDSVEAYRKYYLNYKRDFAKWTKRKIPEWWSGL